MAEPRNDNESSSKVPLHEQDPEKYSGSSDSSEDEIDGQNQEDLIRQMLRMKLHQGKSRTNEDLAKKKSGKVKNIITMAGAGISTSAGIPDFRSPETGLYNNLQKYDLPNPQAIFDIEYFEERPEPFFQLAKELYPGQFEPTPCHYFIKLLEQKGLLLRHYTQNIDTLERVANISGDKLVEAHGTFHSSHCIEPKCRKEYTQEWMKEQIMRDVIPTCKECNSVVKPDIVFFGEQLPDRFFTCLVDDFKICDLLIIMGTSLTVQPFANLVDRYIVKTLN
ncbi:hypothetical protein TCAL_05189 [Tigriopus californicus]|uniref:protein acetyllysine N-acetyltransferase n=1 Tax=Tigriopus californicus TaxID=6832 RepID=A0A553NZ69_TIGCA|nr:hypothetical protein TCAL_05189 [Tigriopus californicus]